MGMCFGTRVEMAKAAVSAVSPEEAQALRQAGVLFLDPRPAEAIAASTGLIPGAFVVSLEEIAEGRLPEDFADRSAPVVTACQAGPMGAVAAHELMRLGYTDVRYVDGGTQGWLDAGYETE